VLTDGNCVSGCEVFAGAVKDLHLGTLIGTRTAGIVAGGALPWVLDDGSVLALPPRHGLRADHELINGIRVAPDYYIPGTALDLATGQDPDIAKDSPCSRPDSGSHSTGPGPPGPRQGFANVDATW
jgi:carboxyl-terminal processing protease